MLGVLVNTGWGKLEDMSDADAEKFWTTKHDYGPEPGTVPLPIATPGGIPLPTGSSYEMTAEPGMIGTFAVLSLQDAIRQHLSFETAPGIANEVANGIETVSGLVSDIPAFVADYCSIRPMVSGCGNPGGLISDAQSQLRNYYDTYLAAARTQSYNYPGLAPLNQGAVVNSGGNGTGVPNRNNATTIPGGSHPTGSTNARGTVSTPIVDFTNPQNQGTGNVSTEILPFNDFHFDPSTWDMKTWLEIGAIAVVGVIGFSMMKGR